MTSENCLNVDRKSEEVLCSDPGRTNEDRFTLHSRQEWVVPYDNTANDLTLFRLPRLLQLLTWACFSCTHVSFDSEHIRVAFRSIHAKLLFQCPGSQEVTYGSMKLTSLWFFWLRYAAILSNSEFVQHRAAPPFRLVNHISTESLMGAKMFDPR